MGRARAAARVSIRLRLPLHARPRTEGRGAEASVGFSRSSCLENYPTAPKSFPQATRWGCSMLHAGCYYAIVKRRSEFRYGECARGMRPWNARPQAQASRVTAHATRDDPQPHGPARAGEGCQPRRASHLAAPGQAAHRTADAHAASAGAGERGAGSAARADVAQRSRAHRCCSLCTHDSKRMIDICVVFVHA